MTHLPAVLSLLATTSTPKKPQSSDVFLFLLIGIAIVGYFFFLRPRQRAAQAARQGNRDIEVGDEVQTIGGVIGTVLEIHGDRYTLLTGSTEADGNLEGPQPTRIVFIRQAIARKVEPIVDAGVEDDDVDDAGVDDEVEDGAQDSSVVDDDEGTEPGEGEEEAEEA